MNGNTRNEPTIYFSGFSSQGDGACFEGDYSYKKGALKAIVAECPTDKTLHQIARDLQTAQQPYFYRLTATMKHSGHYYHAGCMSVDVEGDSDIYYNDLSEAEDNITEALRDFANWMYKQLENEYDYRMSDENVDESIIINEYSFTSDGEIV